MSENNLQDNKEVSKLNNKDYLSSFKAYADYSTEIRDALSTSIVDVMREKEYYGRVLGYLKRIYIPEMPYMAGVSPNGELVFSKRFLQANRVARLKIILHECGHLIRDHFVDENGNEVPAPTTKDPKELAKLTHKHQIRNIAQDILINQTEDITKYVDGLYDVQSLEFLRKTVLKGATAILNKDKNRFARFFGNTYESLRSYPEIKSNQTWMYYHAILNEISELARLLTEVKKSSIKKNEDGTYTIDNGSGEGGKTITAEQLGEMGFKDESGQEGGVGTLAEGYRYELSDEAKEQLSQKEQDHIERFFNKPSVDFHPDMKIDGLGKKKIRDALMKGWRDTSTAGKGQLSNGERELVEGLFNVKVNWEHVLNNIVTSNVKISHGYTRSRPNRRYGNMIRGKKKKVGIHIVYVWDTSGSMGSEENAAVLSCVHKQYSRGNSKISIIEADAEVQNVYEYDGKKRVEITGRGGTMYAPAIEQARQLNPDVIILAGDGGCFDTQDIKDPGVPFIWLMTPGTNKPHVDFGYEIEIAIKGGRQGTHNA